MSQLGEQALQGSYKKATQSVLGEAVDDPFRGMLLKLAAVALFSAMVACIKATAPIVPSGEAVFFRSLFALPVILIWLASQGQLRAGLKTARPWGHLVRGFVGTTAMGLGFAAAGILPLPQLTAISYATPILTVVLAILVLGEPVRTFRLVGVVLGLLGIGLVLWPDLAASRTKAEGITAATGVMVALASALAYAVGALATRSLTRTEETATIVFWFTMSSTLIGLATLPIEALGVWVLPRPPVLGLLVAAGLLGAFGQIALTSAFRAAHASTVAPFEYASIFVAVGIGYTVFGEMPTVWTLAGAAIVIVGGIVIVRGEREGTVQCFR